MAAISAALCNRSSACSNAIPTTQSTERRAKQSGASLHRCHLLRSLCHSSAHRSWMVERRNRWAAISGQSTVRLRSHPGCCSHVDFLLGESLDTDGATLGAFEARGESAIRWTTGKCRWRIARLPLCCPASGGGRRRFGFCGDLSGRPPVTESYENSTGIAKGDEDHGSVSCERPAP